MKKNVFFCLFATVVIFGFWVFLEKDTSFSNFGLYQVEEIYPRDVPLSMRKEDFPIFLFKEDVIYTYTEKSLRENPDILIFTLDNDYHKVEISATEFSDRGFPEFDTLLTGTVLKFSMRKVNSVESDLTDGSIFIINNEIWIYWYAKCPLLYKLKPV